MVHKFLNRKTLSEAMAITKEGASVKEQLAEELHKPVIKNSREQNFMRDLKTVFGQYI